MNRFEGVISKLTAQLKMPLPGETAQLMMGSDIRMNELKFYSENENSKKSGVMILLYPNEETVFSALILRNTYEGTHSGQVALPGGKYEDEDSDLIATALRETNEEIGVDSNSINIIGQLSRLFIPPSDYIVYPAIGFLNSRPSFKPDESEVQEIIEYPLSSLLDEGTIKSKEFSARNDIIFKAPYFDINGHVVWGATAMILSEFKAILDNAGISSLL